MQGDPPPPRIPPIYSQSGNRSVIQPPSSDPSMRRMGFWPGFSLGCAVSLVGALLLVALVVIVSLAVGFRTITRSPSGAMQFSTDASESTVDVSQGKSTEQSGIRVEGFPITDPKQFNEIAAAEIQAALDDEQFDHAEAMARSLLEADKNDATRIAILQSVLISRALAAEDVSTAAALLDEAYEQALELEPEIPLSVAELWLQEGEPQRALALTERVMKSMAATVPDEDADPEYSNYLQGIALVIRGSARAELGDPAAGAADIEAAIKLAPDEETAKEWREYLETVQSKGQ